MQVSICGSRDFFRFPPRASDLTGQEIQDDEEVVRLVVEYHPDYDEPITLEARPEEVDIDTIAAEDFVVLSYYAPGQPDPLCYYEVYLNLAPFGCPTTPRRRSRSSKKKAPTQRVSCQ